MKNKIFDTLTPEQLIQEFEGLKSATKIAKKYGFNICTLYSAFKEINFDCMVKPRINLTKEILQKEYDELQSFRKIGKKYGASGEGIRTLCEKLGVKTNDLPRYTYAEDFFTRDNEETFYVAGFFAADGCVKIRKMNNRKNLVYQIQLQLATKDRVILEKIKSLLKWTGPTCEITTINSKRNPKWEDSYKCGFTITSKKLVDDIARFNIVPRKTHILTFPQWLIDHPLVHHFIRGYNDGDGCFHTSKNKGKSSGQIYFSMRGTAMFLGSCRSIIEKNCDIKVNTTNIRISSGIGQFGYGGNGIVAKVAKFLYKDATIYLERKYNIVKHLMANDYQLASTRVKSKLTKETLEKDYEELKDLHKMAEKHEVSYASVRNYMVKFNIPYEVPNPMDNFLGRNANNATMEAMKKQPH
jgi:hypothetical protein